MDRLAARSDRQNASIDKLTGTYRRDAGVVELEHDVQSAQRTGSPLGVCFIDVDGLKAINDEHGHLAGDRILAQVADTIRRSLHCNDVLLRFGGDEFVFAVLGLDEKAVRGVITKIESDMRAADLATITCGLAFVTATTTSLSDILAEADADLYRQRRATRR